MKRALSIMCLAAMTLLPGDLLAVTRHHHRQYRRHYAASRRYRRHKTYKRVGVGAAGGAAIGALAGGGIGAAIGAAAGAGAGYAYDRHKKHQGR